MLAASDIRRRWRSVVALTLLVGAVGAIVLATAAGARRSDTALARFNTYSRSSDLEISIGIPTAAELASFRRSPGVAAFAYIHAYSLVIEGQDNLAIGAPDDAAMARFRLPLISSPNACRYAISATPGLRRNAAS